MARGELRRGGEVLLCDVREVEEEVRQARAFGEEELRYAPWTGDEFRRLDTIPALADAFDTPDARLAAWIRARRVPWLTLAAVAGLAALGTAQILALVGSIANDVDPTPLLLLGATGYEPLLLEGAWWSPWTSQVVHAGALHLVLNLPLLGYCGLRVERALGPAATLIVVAAAVLGGTVAVTALGALPVVGASIVAYGLWGAQIAIGLRHGDAVPVGWRGFYGWGNLVLFIPLFVTGLTNEGVSHLGHVGGLVGGVVAAALLRAESRAPRAGLLAARRRNLVLAALLAVAPMVTGAALSRWTAGIGWPSERVEQDGLVLDVPWRMARNPVRVAGMPGWRVSGNGDAPVWAARMRLDTPADPAPAALAATLARAFDAEPVAVGEPVTADGWTTWTWEVGGGTVVERTRRAGWRLVRVGYRVERAAPREALYRRLIEGVEVGEPDALTQARRLRAQWPDSPDVAFRLGEELALTGLAEEADRTWAALETRTDGWEWDAARARLALGCALPTLAQDEAWALAWLARAPEEDTSLREAAACWLASRTP